MIDVVFAMDRANVPLPDGRVANVHKGQHWSKTDPVVQARPGLFTEDPRYGLLYTEPPPGYDGELNELPEGFRDVDEFESASAAPGEKRSVRRRSS